MVVFNFTKQYKKSEILRHVAKTLSGFEGALPDTYGMSLNEITALLNDFRSQYKST